MPEQAIRRVKLSFSSAVTAAEQQNRVTPAPTAAGMLGMMRMTGLSSPRSRPRVCRSFPAIMETISCRSFRAFSVSRMPSSMSSSIWGFTPRNRMSARAAASWLYTARPPSSFARRWAFSGLRFASSSSSARPLFAAARASAPPMLPGPMKPTSAMGSPPCSFLIE